MVYTKVKQGLIIIISFLFLVTVSIMINSILLPKPASAAVQYTFYASSTGSGTTCSLASPCSLTGVQTKIRTVNAAMTGDIVVNLRGGTYTLTSTFALTSADSGNNGWTVIYQNYTGEIPVLSGGTATTGWTSTGVNNIWQSNVGTSLQTRQLYFNGVRGIRAKGGTLPGAVDTFLGHTTTDSTLVTYGNISDMEFVYNKAWLQGRCGVQSITGASSPWTVTMKQPCYTMLNGPRSNDGVDNPSWMENAFEFLDAEGEWYLNRTTGYLYYKPRVGESMTSPPIVVATLETLISGTGTFASPIHNITFKGITFSYATWLEPNGNNGFPEIQANTRVPGSKPYSYGGGYDTPPLANLTFSRANFIKFERNIFTHLGGAALNFENGSQSNTVVGNLISDISSNGIMLGNTSVEDHHPTPTLTAVTKDNTISNNYIHDIGVEYKGAVGIWTGYTENTLIQHNEITNTPYSGISIG